MAKTRAMTQDERINELETKVKRLEAAVKVLQQIDSRKDTRESLPFWAPWWCRFPWWWR